MINGCDTLTSYSFPVVASACWKRLINSKRLIKRIDARFCRLRLQIQTNTARRTREEPIRQRYFMPLCIARTHLYGRMYATRPRDTTICYCKRSIICKLIFIKDTRAHLSADLPNDLTRLLFSLFWSFKLFAKYFEKALYIHHILRKGDISLWVIFFLYIAIYNKVFCITFKLLKISYKIRKCQIIFPKFPELYLRCVK